MHLQRQAGAHFGKGATGTSTVGINGSTPALLVGQVAGAQFGPSWYTAIDIIYQSGGTGAGPWILQSYDVTTPALTTEDADGQNFMAAGGGVWAAYIAGQGVRTNVGGLGPFPNAALLDVSSTGQVAICTTQSTATGLEVYDSGGNLLLEIPGVQIIAPARLGDDILAFQSANSFTGVDGNTYNPGWHLVNVTTGLVPVWFPRIDSVNWVIPVMDGTKLYVVERSNFLTVRPANKAAGYKIQPLPIAFNPDGMRFSSGVIRSAYCTNLGESVDSLEMIDLTVATGASQIGVVSGGAIVFSAGPTFTAEVFPVGPQEGSGLVDQMIPPVEHPVTDPATALRMTVPWQAFMQSISAGVFNVGQFAQNIPSPVPAGPSFGVFQASGQPAVAATAPNDIATFTSLDGSLTFTFSPFGKTLDFSVTAPGVVRHIQVTVTDAELKALPTTAKTLVAAQGANTIVVLIQAFARSDFSAGAYTNVDPDDAYLYVALENEEVWSSAIINRSTVPVSWLDEFLVNAAATTPQNVTFLPYNDTDPVIGLTPFVPGSAWAASVDVPLQLILFNNGAGNLTGGNAANALVLDVFYAVVSV